MASECKVLAVVAGRGGSKGLPGKNVADLGGRPLIAWTVEAALNARELDRVILSSDDDAIMQAARDAGCEVPFVRPVHLATDQASIYDVLFHALDWEGGQVEWVVLLQATSPFRTAADIDATLLVAREMQAPAAVSVSEAPKPPQWMYTLDDRQRLRPLLERSAALRRQELPAAYVPNGAVYAAHVPWLRREKTFYSDQTVAYVMPRDRAVDIDGPLDLALARTILASN